MNRSPSAAAPRPGRFCPLDYSYRPADFARPPELHAEVLYVAGGLYGNLPALDAIEGLAAAEDAPVTILFNGDFHWFDAEPDWFEAVAARVARHDATRGNVETELSRDKDLGAGCGCAYPETVTEATVRHSNAILTTLRDAAPPETASRLARLPMHLVVGVGGLRVGVVHGDAHSLAGWEFAHDRLAGPGGGDRLKALQLASSIDVFACSHTCLPVLHDRPGPGRLTVINNGAAGMPNFRGTRFGVITRIAGYPSPHPSLYGVDRDGVRVDALAVHYDTDAFLRRFTSRWPAGSPAHLSYYRRIMDGPEHDLADAVV